MLIGLLIRVLLHKPCHFLLEMVHFLTCMSLSRQILDKGPTYPKQHFQRNTEGQMFLEQPIKYPNMHVHHQHPQQGQLLRE
jgi:hypothetical protein